MFDSELVEHELLESRQVQLGRVEVFFMVLRERVPMSADFLLHRLVLFLVGGDLLFQLLDSLLELLLVCIDIGLCHIRIVVVGATLQVVQVLLLTVQLNRVHRKLGPFDEQLRGDLLDVIELIGE